ncbi:Holliday junction branch migration DNA helicase RuvB [Oenococcus kitaharae]|uniref:Holliday junction branch migration DNA helicase RuvB n=1 Tax=Oenococcus TaxID=46254 RepID=UPI0021E7A993|nr:Holliday junction branch migration DNA helicase RuvB [Oenococcus kitaharae]MCV3297043.1 Holliday junction branch migration DNA helicase RuvB [Oenococcus kitaharae]
MNEDDKKILDAQALADDNDAELTLRPQYLSEYIGQKEIKDQLSVYLKAAKQRKEALDHVLLFGPPGLGKTTLAVVIANEMGANIKTTSGPAIEKAGDLVALLNELEAGDILFIDEIHRLPKSVEEVLYSAMEDFYVDIVVGQGETAHAIHFPLPPFTLIGATTRAGMLSAPLRDRFGIVAHMRFYPVSDLQLIARRSAEIFNTSIAASGAAELALRSRGTPRIVNRLLKRVRDFAQVAGKSEIDQQTVDSALNKLQVDGRGLDETDLKYLKTLIQQYKGGPAGVNALASNIGEDTETVEEMIEPYLLQIGFIQRTPRGRQATEAAYEHLHIPYQTGLQA